MTTDNDQAARAGDGNVPAGFAPLVKRITDYLSGGGLFNPEQANHDAVRLLLIECRATMLAAAPAVSAPAERQLGSDREIALMEGHRVPAVDAYFKARPSLDGPDERKAYEAGYQRGWRDSNSAHPVQAPATESGSDA